MRPVFRCIQILACILFLGSFLGCNDIVKELRSLNANFEGHLVAGSFPNQSGVTIGQKFRIYISPDKGLKSARIAAVSQDRKNLFEMVFKLKRLGGLKLALPYRSEPYHLKKSSLNVNRVGMTQCFETREERVIVLCLGTREFSFRVAEPNGKTIVHLQGGQTSKVDVPMEQPVELTLTQALKQALNRNFQSLYDFETTVQAHNAALANQLNFIPHFRFVNAVGIGVMAPPVLISSLSDWAPFLVPSRWFRAKQTRENDYASRLGFQVIQANLAQQVHFQVSALKHDQAKLKYILDYKKTADDLIDRIGKIAQNDSTHPVMMAVSAFRESLDIDESQATSVINSDRAALAQLVGYFNPRAVLDVTLDIPIVNIQSDKTYDGAKIAGEALNVSLELQQFQFVETALRAKKGDIALSWLDPAGSTDVAFGFNLIPQMRTVESEIRQIEIKSNLVRQQILQTSAQIERSTGRARINYKEMNETLAAYDRRIEALMARISEEFIEGSKNLSLYEISVNEVVKSLQASLALKLQQENELLAWELGQIREDRLLFYHRTLMGQPGHLD